MIATVRPYDDPGVERVWYRLRPIASTIVHKTHIVYPLSDAKLQRLRELFLDSDWTADANSRPTRPRRPRTRSSPSTQMPARSRYEYLLDDAQYFVMTFIRGPVCRGQVAVDVIEDQFWVAFLDPSRDLSVSDSRVPREERRAAQPAGRAPERFRSRRAVARVRPQAAQVPGRARELLRRHRSPAPRAGARLDLGRRPQESERAAHRLPQLRQRRRS